MLDKESCKLKFFAEIISFSGVLEMKINYIGRLLEMEMTTKNRPSAMLCQNHKCTKPVPVERPEGAHYLLTFSNVLLRTKPFLLCSKTYSYVYVAT
jgi:hypothetical protein